MAANDYYSTGFGQSSPQPKHVYAESAPQPTYHQPQIQPQQAWDPQHPEPPKSPWERPAHLHQAPQGSYQFGQPQYQEQPQYYGGNGQQPVQHTVIVKDKSSKEDVALGFCAGCATACCCCGCTVM